jgi:tRNA1Val (adenine37-N6)-methyltransferase
MNKEEYLHDGERLDDLQRNGLYIIQDPDKFCFGMDAVLLSGFVAEHLGKGKKNLLDLCSGGGIIPLLLSAKTDVGHITGMELQEDMADMAERSVELNGLGSVIEILENDLRKAAGVIPAASFDAVTVNPPYFKCGHGIINPDDAKTIARHEVSCTLEDVLETACYALKEGGMFYMVHKPQRLSDIICSMRQSKIEPKTLKTVHPRKDAEPSMILIEGRKGGGSELRIEKPLIIYGEDGKYTEEMYTIYGY